MSIPTQQDVIDIVKTIFDPEIPVDIYELGLIYEVKVSADGFVHIDMTLTSPNCPVAESLPQDVEAKVAFLGRGNRLQGDHCVRANMDTGHDERRGQTGTRIPMMRQPENDAPTRGIAVLGSTGSIGTQALEVIREQKESLHVEVLSANSSADLLVAQALEFRPNAVVIGDDSKWKQVNDALFDHGIKVYSGNEALEQVVETDGIDMVLTAMVGAAGLKPTMRAIAAGKHIALANKETLVVAGELVMKAAKQRGVAIHPVDSEHSAIYQCLAGETHNPIEKVILTASGGPFRGRSLASLEGVTKADALRHPNWEMGAKITIDSASLMNKGLGGDRSQVAV